MKNNYLLFIIILIIITIWIYNYYLYNEYFNNTQQSIPKIIWQTYKTKNLPIDAKNARQTWIDKNPEWDIKLFDDNDIEQYILEYWDDRMHKFYKALPIGVMKADLWRYLILTTHGGVYADIDSICKIPINTWISDLNISTQKNILVFGLENNIHFCQWTILSTPNHDAMKYICEYILINFEKNGIDIKRNHFVHATTGPGIWTDAIRAYLNLNQNESPDIILNMYNNNKIKNNDIVILPSKSFRTYYVQNLYGSQNFGDNYVKWEDEVKLLQNNN
jgi:hypothetical protein